MMPYTNALLLLLACVRAVSAQDEPSIESRSDGSILLSVKEGSQVFVAVGRNEPQPLALQSDVDKLASALAALQTTVQAMVGDSDGTASVADQISAASTLLSKDLRSAEDRLNEDIKLIGDW